MNGRISWLPGLVAMGLIALSAGCGDDDDENGGNGGGDVPAEVQVTDADDGGSFEVAVDGTVIVALPSNPSTGYSWAIVAPEPANLELEGEPKFVPAGSTTPVVGAPGTEVFTLKATSTGTSILSMAYSRSFEPGATPEKTFTVTVEVR
jgi:inhibitor of cysteine peptidase